MADLFRFLKFNLYHYALALWGFRLQLEPDYPAVERFFPSLIRDSVYEWRTYGAMMLWGVFVAYLPEPSAWILIILWAKWSWGRAAHFQTNYAFWKQAYQECPDKKRVQVQYFQWIVRETERRMKAGQNRFDVAALDREALRVERRIVEGDLC